MPPCRTERQVPAHRAFGKFPVESKRRERESICATDEFGGCFTQNACTTRPQLRHVVWQNRLLRAVAFLLALSTFHFHFLLAPSTVTRELLNAILILLGILSAGLGLKGFLLPSGFIDGGVTGVSLLLAMVTSLPLAFWLPVINVPFVVLGYRHLGAPFAMRSALAIGGARAVLALVQFPTVTHDRLLDAVFGGFFLGAGIGLAVRGGAVLDGTEIAALLISKRSTLLRVGDVILGFNVVLFLVAMAVLGVEAGALFDPHVPHGGADARLRHPRHRGIHGDDDRVEQERGDSRGASPASSAAASRSIAAAAGSPNVEQDILYCVVTRLEIGKIKAIARGIDQSAFIVSHALSDVEGGVVKKTALHIAIRVRRWLGCPELLACFSIRLSGTSHISATPT